MKLRLGKEDLGGADKWWFALCEHVKDKKGCHVLSCTAGGHATRCHNTTRNHIFHTARAAGLNPLREESGLLPGGPQRRPGDVTMEGTQ